MKFIKLFFIVLLLVFATSDVKCSPAHNLQFGILSKEKCYDGLGCFNTADFFDIVNRPINVLPFERKNINTRFALYTRQNRPHEPPKPEWLKLNNVASVKNSHFDPKKLVKFIVHGFLDTGFLKWVNLLGNALLDKEDLNIIVVDWSHGNNIEGLPYTQATANTWIVGGEIALFIKFLQKEFGVKPQDCHIIGHSLGSHVAGYAGARLKGTLGRITALDAAEPYFQRMPEHVRLDPSDAIFVDAIHTDGKTILLLGFGMMDPVGHIDFYPNNGRDQPGCNLEENTISIATEGLEQGIRNFAACNHQRAIDLYTASILSSDCQFVSHECQDYELYLGGKCRSCGKDGQKCAMMGYNIWNYSNPTNHFNKKFYLTTFNKDPYCLHHYIVKITLQDIKDQKDEKGIMKVTLHGERAELGPITLNEETMEIRRGHSYGFLVKNRISLGSVQRVDFEWISKGIPSIFHRPKLHLSSIQVEPIDIISEELRKKVTTTMCQLSPEPAKPDKLFTLYTLDSCKQPPYLV